MSKYGVISDPYFLVFRLNTEIYVLNIEADNKDLKDKLRDLKDRSCVLMASLSMKMSRGAILKKI